MSMDLRAVMRKIVEEPRPIHMGTAYCEKYKGTHVNCDGCESLEGCSRMTTLHGIFAAVFVGNCEVAQDMINDLIKRENERGQGGPIKW